MRKGTLFRSAASIALAVVLLLALSVPALAAEDNQIIIKAPIDEPGEKDRFQVYQVFKGSLVPGNPDEIDGIEWGSGVDSSRLLINLQSSTQVVPTQTETPYDDSMTTFGAQFGAAYNEYNDKYIGQLEVAEFVAQWLGTMSSSYTTSKTYNPYADAFARAVAASLNEEGAITGEKTTNSTNALWTIGVTDPGYYLVKDTYTGTVASVSSYILRVLGKEEVDIKASVPTVEKKVDGKDGVLTETEIDHIFTLTGKVTENISEYNTYAYTFTDTISKGLTLSDLDGLTVTYKNTVGVTQNATFTKTTDYSVDSKSKPDTGETVLTVKFDDLKKSLQDRVEGIDLKNQELVQNIRIIVTYTARLNESAVIGSAGNPNEVFLSYSNNPYSTGTGETVPDEVNTYTLALRIIKKDANGPLPGVKFKLMQGSSTTPTTGSDNSFASFNTVTDTSETYQEIKSWNKGNIAAVGDALTTDTKGVFNIHGLSVGTYTLVETEAPAGYETMKPVVFEITGSVKGDGSLGTVTLSTDTTKRHDVEWSNPDFSGHNAQLTLTNFRSPILPHTGGIGRMIVLIVSGAAVLAGIAVICFALRRKNNSGR